MISKEEIERYFKFYNETEKLSIIQEQILLLKVKKLISENNHKGFFKLLIASSTKQGENGILEWKGAIRTKRYYESIKDETIKKELFSIVKTPKIIL